MTTLNPNIALVVLSGGQDSVTCLHWALSQGFDVHAVTFNYNQRHSREIQAARAVMLHVNLEHRHHVINVPDVLQSTSPLTSCNERLETYESAAQMAEIIGDRIEKTFVPMRNALFLTIAANLAVSIGAGTIVTGVCQEDNANYPDCTQQFIDLIAATLNQSLGLNMAGWEFGDDAPKGGLAIVTPLMNLTKAETVKLALRLGEDAIAALAWSHTAYSGEYPPITQDHATVLRAQGFLEAGVPDPLIVRAWVEGKMQLPDTPNYQPLVEAGPDGVPGVYRKLIDALREEEEL